MTTTTMEDQQVEAQYIPGDDEVKDSSGGRSWRIANGEIVRGRKEDKTLETRERITGILTRVGIAKGEIVIQGIRRKVHKLELEFKLRDGDLHLGSNLLDDDDNFRPSGSSVGIAWCATQMVPNKVYTITSSQGPEWVDDRGKTRQGTSYVNLSAVAADGSTTPIMRPKKPKDAPKETYTEQFEKLMVELDKHPLRKDREVKAQESSGGRDAVIPWDAYNEAAPNYGWPSVDQDTGEAFTSLANELDASPPHRKYVVDSGGKPGPYASVEAIPAQIYAMLIKSMKEGKQPPAKLAPFVSEVPSL